MPVFALLMLLAFGSASARTEPSPNRASCSSRLSACHEGKRVRVPIGGSGLFDRHRLSGWPESVSVEFCPRDVLVMWDWCRFACDFCKTVNRAAKPSTPYHLVVHRKKLRFSNCYTLVFYPDGDQVAGGYRRRQRRRLSMLICLCFSCFDDC